MSCKLPDFTFLSAVIQAPHPTRQLITESVPMTHNPFKITPLFAQVMSIIQRVEA